MKTITQKINFPVRPEVFFSLFLDSKGHSEGTGGKAVMTRKVGGKFSAWDGYIKGKNLAIVPGRLILQSWRTNSFRRGDINSVLLLTLEKVKGGCQVTMVHAAVPDHAAAGFTKGWKDHYWQPIAKYLKAHPDVKE